MVRPKVTVIRKSFGFRLNVELVKQLKVIAINEDKPVNVLLEEGIQDIIKKRSKK